MTYVNAGKQVVFEHRETLKRTHIADAADNEKAHFLTTAANAYDDFDYMAEADKTCSIVYNPQFVDRDVFVRVLETIAFAAEELNVAKKLLFRGRTPEELDQVRPALHESLAVEFDPANPVEGEVDMLHGIVGVLTEAGEMAEVLLHRVKNGEFDRVNVAEEGGDVMWYLARQFRGLDTDFRSVQRMNINKLHGRHGGAFDVFRDANRNLQAERERLETDAAPLPLLEQAAGASPLDAIPPRQRNDPPLPEGMVGSVERHARTPKGDVEGMDC